METPIYLRFGGIIRRMEENFTEKELKSLVLAFLRIVRLYLKAYESVYAGAKGAAKRARARGDKNEENRCYKRFREKTGLTMREFAKLRKL